MRSFLPWCDRSRLLLSFAAFVGVGDAVRAGEGARGQALEERHCAPRGRRGQLHRPS